MKTSVILFVAGLAVAKSAGTTMRDLEQSWLQFNPIGGIGSITVKCSDLGHDIAPQNTYGSLFCSDNVLTVVAGNDHSSGLVADNFLHSVTAKLATNYGGSYPDCFSPKKLNFYVEVNVTFTQGTEDRGTHTLWIGQGTYGFIFPVQNWWIGGPRCHSNPNPLSSCGIKCDNEDGQIVLFDNENMDDDLAIYVTLPSPDPTSKPTPAPTPAPTTRTPTTRAPTRNSDPDCLRTHPGVEKRSPYPDIAADMCGAHAAWLTANYNIAGHLFPGDRNTTYEDAGVDGTACTVFNYLSNNTSEDYWCKCRCPADE
jgi:hypothetical protein